MLTLTLSLSAAVAYGLSDFLGGVLSRRNHFLPVNVVANVAGVAAALVALVVAGTAPVTPAVAAWSVGSGLLSGMGGLALYRGFSRGEMAVVGPVSAVGSAVLPVLVGLLLGERFAALTGLGILLALPAIWLVAGGGGGTRMDPVSTTDGLLAGAGFGGMFIGVERAGPDSGLWPVLLAQVGALGLGLVAMAATRGWRGRSEPRSLWRAVVPGVLVPTAIALYQFSLRTGSLATSSVITSLYPAVTVLLAAWLLKERTTARQRAGLTLAGAAVVMIVLPG